MSETRWKEIEAKHAAKAAARPAHPERHLPIWERASMKAVLESLPEDERGPFRQLVDDYRACAFFTHGSHFVDVKTIVELVKLGWRKTS